jgi:hypothetical protein
LPVFFFGTTKFAENPRSYSLVTKIVHMTIDYLNACSFSDDSFLFCTSVHYADKQLQENVT